MSVAVGELERSAPTIRELNGREDLGRACLRPVHGGREHPTFGLGVQMVFPDSLEGQGISPNLRPRSILGKEESCGSLRISICCSEEATKEFPEVVGTTAKRMPRPITRQRAGVRSGNPTSRLVRWSRPPAKSEG